MRRDPSFEDTVRKPLSRWTRWLPQRFRRFLRRFSLFTSSHSNEQTPTQLPCQEPIREERLKKDVVIASGSSSPLGGHRHKHKHLHWTIFTEHNSLLFTKRKTNTKKQMVLYFQTCSLYFNTIGWQETFSFYDAVKLAVAFRCKPPILTLQTNPLITRFTFKSAWRDGGERFSLRPLHSLSNFHLIQDLS